MYEKLLWIFKRAGNEDNKFENEKKVKLLKIEQQELYENAKFCYIFKESFKNKYVKDKKYRKVRDHGNYRS